MRPFPDEILRSMQFSLDTYVIPNVDDKWGSYVAKVMRRMLVHLERRWELEMPLLVEDTRDLHTLFTLLSGALQEVDGTAELTAAIRRTMTENEPEPSGLPSVRSLTETNEAYRATLSDVIEGLDALADQGGEPAQLVPIRDEIRQYLRREVDRDNQLAEPTFMSFAPPTPSKGDDAKGDAA